MLTKEKGETHLYMKCFAKQENSVEGLADYFVLLGVKGQTMVKTHQGKHMGVTQPREAQRTMHFLCEGIPAYPLLVLMQSWGEACV